MVLTLQGKKFSDQVAALEASVKALKASNSQLAEDLKAATNTIRAKDRELDAAFKRVAAAEQTEVRNKVGCQGGSMAEEGRCRPGCAGEAVRFASALGQSVSSHVCCATLCLHAPLGHAAACQHCDLLAALCLSCGAVPAPNSQAAALWHCCGLLLPSPSLQELQNSILDLKRQLEEAAEDQATLLAVQVRAERHVNQVCSPLCGSECCPALMHMAPLVVASHVCTLNEELRLVGVLQHQLLRRSVCASTCRHLLHCGPTAPEQGGPGPRCSTCGGGRASCCCDWSSAGWSQHRPQGRSRMLVAPQTVVDSSSCCTKSQ